MNCSIVWLIHNTSAGVSTDIVVLFRGELRL